MERNRADYIYGNTVRHAIPAPQEPQRRVREKRPERKKVGYEYATPGYALFVIISGIILATVIVSFVGLHATIAGQAESITVIQRQISDMKLENDAKQESVENSVNIDYIKEEALRMGMVYMENDQVVHYESPTQNYVKQYEDIPENGIIANSRAASEQGNSYEQ